MLYGDEICPSCGSLNLFEDIESGDGWSCLECDADEHSFGELSGGGDDVSDYDDLRDELSAEIATELEEAIKNLREAHSDETHRLMEKIGKEIERVANWHWRHEIADPEKNWCEATLLRENRRCKENAVKDGLCAAHWRIMHEEDHLPTEGRQPRLQRILKRSPAKEIQAGKPLKDGDPF